MGQTCSCDVDSADTIQEDWNPDPPAKAEVGWQTLRDRPADAAVAGESADEGGKEEREETTGKEEETEKESVRLVVKGAPVEDNTAPDSVEVLGKGPPAKSGLAATEQLATNPEAAIMGTEVGTPERATPEDATDDPSDLRTPDTTSRGPGRALWVPDELVNSCQRCGVEFNSLWRRKHHCRRCGACVCDTCSAKRCALPGSEARQRVCDLCFAAASRLRRSSLASLGSPGGGGSPGRTRRASDASDVRDLRVSWSPAGTAPLAEEPAEPAGGGDAKLGRTPSPVLVDGLYEEADELYCCPGGHPYAIQDGAAPLSISLCQKCGELIGGVRRHRWSPRPATAPSASRAPPPPMPPPPIVSRRLSTIRSATRCSPPTSTSRTRTSTCCTRERWPSRRPRRYRIQQWSSAR